MYVKPPVPKVPQGPARKGVKPGSEPRQRPLRFAGPDAGDPFRFTWWNTPEGAAVWIEHRGRWRAGVVVGLGRCRALVAIEATGFKRLMVPKPYSELRRRR
jgi:hypothetical protein